MNKKTITKLLGIAMAACLTGGVVGLGNVIGANADDTTVTDKDWLPRYAGCPSTAVYDTETKNSTMTLTSYGEGIYYNHKVKLDGLTVKLGATTQKQGKLFGFGFTSESAPGKYTLSEVSTVNVYWAPALYGEPGAMQNRIFISDTHDKATKPTIAYTDAALTTQGNVFGLDTSYVITQSSDDLYTFTFALVTENPGANDDVYSMTIGVEKGNQPMSGQNATVYFSESEMADILNDNGECYVSVWGMEGPHVFTVGVEDDNKAAYKAGAYVEAQEALDAYEEAAEAAATNGALFDEAMAAKEALATKITTLRGNDQIDFNLAKEAIDKTLSGNQDAVKMDVQSVYDTAMLAIDTLAAEENITNDNIEVAKSALASANAKYAEMKAMLNAENQAYFESLTAECDYDIAHAEAKQWVIALEKTADDLAHIVGDELILAIVDAKAQIAGYADSYAKTVIDTVLEADDKQALNQRISAAEATVGTYEEANITAVIEHYLSVFESKIDDEDLTIKGNLDEAKKSYFSVVNNVSIIEEDGEQYTRFNTAYSTLKTAIEEYISVEIAGVGTSLSTQCTLLSQFAPIRTRWEAIALSYLLEANTAVEAEYNTVKAAIEQHEFYYIATHGDGMSDVEKTNDGLYFTDPGKHPQRLNYNKALDLTQGATVKVQLTEMAFINTDMKAANNLCFNFLDTADSYKSMSNGFTVMIWLFGGSSSVKIYTKSGGDTPIDSLDIATPIDGSELTISVKYDAAYPWVLEGTTAPTYVFEINGIKKAVKAEQIRENGATEDMTTCYFSMASYMDDRDGVESQYNAYTLVSINEVSFKTEQSGGNGGEGGNGGDTTDKKGCGSAIGGVGIATAIAAVGVAFAARKRKENE